MWMVAEGQAELGRICDEGEDDERDLFPNGVAVDEVVDLRLLELIALTMKHKVPRMDLKGDKALREALNWTVAAFNGLDPRAVRGSRDAFDVVADAIRTKLGGMSRSIERMVMGGMQAEAERRREQDEAA